MAALVEDEAGEAMGSPTTWGTYEALQRSLLCCHCRRAGCTLTVEAPSPSDAQHVKPSSSKAQRCAASSHWKETCKSSCKQRLQADHFFAITDICSLESSQDSPELAAAELPMETSM